MMREQRDGQLSLVLAVLIASVVTAGAAEIYVATSGNHSDGTSWENAFHNLQVAIDAAAHGDTIYLKGEEFTATEQIAWLQGDDLLIRGGYEGVGAPGAHDPQRWPTKLLLAPEFESRVLYIEGVTGGMLADVTVANGNSVGADYGYGGGGICISNAFAITLRNCIVTNNFAETHGGGIAMIGQNDAMAGPITLDSCLIASNRVYSTSSTKTYGGGLYLQYLTGSMITNCQIVANTIQSSNDPHGGGFSTTRSTITVVDSLIADNSVTGYARGGGAFLGTGGYVYIYQSTFARNRCGGRVGIGGALCGESQYGNIYRNLLIADNVCSGTQSETGGAFYSKSGNIHTIDNCTIVNNSPSGIHRGNSGTVFNLNNSILWGNGDADIIDRLDPEVVKTYPSHCNIGDGFHEGEDGCIALDPGFMHPERGDFRLRSASPCREAGRALSWHTGGSVDLVGNPRVMPPGGKVDMGALEGLPLGATALLVK